MDSACYDSTDNLIIGVRGGRVFKCDPTTGMILAQSDYQQLGMGAASIVWDSGTNRCIVACWNTGHFVTAVSGGARTLSRIIPSTLVVDLTADFATLFGTVLNDANYEGGIASMRASGGNIYGLGWNSTVNSTWCAFKFTPAFGGAAFRQIGISGPAQNLAYVKIGGTNDVIFWGSQNGSDVELWDFTASAFNSSATDFTKGYVAIEFAPVAISNPTAHLYVTRELQFIDVYTAANPPVYVTTINTLRSAFNGVNIRYNPNDGNLYAAGGADGTVIQIAPGTNLFTVISGFDLPYDFVFTSSKRFCVQQGAVPLKAF